MNKIITTSIDANFPVFIIKITFNFFHRRKSWQCFIGRSNYTESQLTNFQTEKEKEFKMEDENGNEVFVKGDDIMKLPDGTLTTMYHYLKNSNKNIKEVLSKEKFEDIDA